MATDKPIAPATRAALKTAPTGAFLYCEDCGAQYSADSGDYWNLPDSHVFTCDHGIDASSENSRPMILAIRYVYILPVGEPAPHERGNDGN